MKLPDYQMGDHVQFTKELKDAFQNTNRVIVQGYVMGVWWTSGGGWSYAISEFNHLGKAQCPLHLETVHERNLSIAVKFKEKK